jgi:GGDEF domain-containing protein
VKAEKLFKGRHLIRPYLSNLLVLVQVSKATNRTIFANQILKMAEKIAADVELTREQIELYKMLSLNYQQNGNYRTALQMLLRYWQLREKFKQTTDQKINLPENIKTLSDKGKELALKFSEKGQVYTQYHNKNKQLRVIIWGLIFVVMGVIIVAFALWFKHKSYLLHADSRELEQPLDYIPSPLHTKKNYYQCYKRARKFNYPLTVGYLQVTNWEELSFQFSSKVMAEVAETIAHIINENLDEFDQVGLLAKGEYILLFPHRTQIEVKAKVKHISDEISARFFANLGDFSVIISSTSKTADIQDIDPFVFLAQLTGSLKN